LFYIQLWRWRYWRRAYELGRHLFVGKHPKLWTAWLRVAY